MSSNNPAGAPGTPPVWSIWANSNGPGEWDQPTLVWLVVVTICNCCFTGMIMELYKHTHFLLWSKRMYNSLMIGAVLVWVVCFLNVISCTFGFWNFTIDKVNRFLSQTAAAFFFFAVYVRYETTFRPSDHSKWIVRGPFILLCLFPIAYVTSITIILLPDPKSLGEYRSRSMYNYVYSIVISILKFFMSLRFVFKVLFRKNQKAALEGKIGYIMGHSTFWYCLVELGFGIFEACIPYASMEILAASMFLTYIRVTLAFHFFLALCNSMAKEFLSPTQVQLPERVGKPDHRVHHPPKGSTDLLINKGDGIPKGPPNLATKASAPISDPIQESETQIISWSVPNTDVSTSDASFETPTKG